MQNAKKKFGIILALSLLLSSHAEGAPDQNEDKAYDSLLREVLKFSKGQHVNYQEASNIATKNQKSSYCLLYLTSIVNYAHKEDPLNQSDIKDINKKYKINDCIQQKTDQELEKQLFGLLSGNCAVNLQIISDGINAEINSRLEQKRQQTRQQTLFDSRLDGSFLGIGLASTVASAILWPVSQYSNACFSFTNQDLPRPSDGKDLQCVYPLNYNVGAPILGGVGLSLVIADVALHIHRYRQARKTNSDIKVEKLQAACPEIPSLAVESPATKGKS